MGEVEFLIVGLGNPGREYRLNRHNAGFLALDQMVGRWGLPAFTRTQNNALITSGEVDGRRVLLAKPQTYMNLSGNSVASLGRFYQIEPERLLVCVDDLNLPFGTLRLRPRGTAGGQRGLQSIIDHLSSDRFPRLRIGIGAPPGQMRHAAYVLQDFHKDELELLNTTLDRCVALGAAWMSRGVELAMSQHNGPTQTDDG